MRFKNPFRLGLVDYILVIALVFAGQFGFELTRPLVPQWREHWLHYDLSRSYLERYGNDGPKKVIAMADPDASLAIGTTQIPDPLRYVYIRKDRNNPVELAVENRNMGDRSAVEIRALNGVGAFDLGITGGYQDGSDMTTNTGFLVAESTTTGGLYIRTNGSSPIRFGVGGSEKARFDDKGNLGLGVNSPQSRLDVDGDIRTNGAVTAQKFTAPNGSMQLGSGGVVEINGHLSLGRPTVITPHDNFLQPTASYHTVYSSFTTVCNHIDGRLYSPGSLLVLQGSRIKSGDVVLIPNRENLAINGEFRFTSLSSVLTLLWTGLRWVEISRSSDIDVLKRSFVDR